MTDEKQEFDELPELEELPELPELSELPELEELPELPEIAPLASEDKAPATTATAPPSPKPKPAPKPKAASKPASKPKAASKPAPKPKAAPKAAPKPKPAPKKPEELPPLELEAEEPVAAEGEGKPGTHIAEIYTLQDEAAIEEESAAPASAGSSPPPTLAPGEIPPLRQLDKAPKHLRLAAQVVAGGTFLPFMGPGDGTAEGVLFSVGAKILTLGAAWLWLQQVLHDFGPKATGTVGNLAKLHLAKKKKEEDKPKRSKRMADSPAKLEHPFPTGLHIVSLLLVVGALVLSLSDTRSAMFGPLGTAEMLMFMWAAFTWVHIARYERWGGFNPLFPLMFLGMFFAGAARMVASLTAGDSMEGIWRIASGLGGAVVTVGGGLAAFTIVEAMMEAKKEGDRKKAEALEARRAARKNRKS